jgi:hypothetical protein
MPRKKKTEAPPLSVDEVRQLVSAVDAVSVSLSAFLFAAKERERTEQELGAILQGLGPKVHKLLSWASENVLSTDPEIRKLAQTVRNVVQVASPPPTCQCLVCQASLAVIQIL